MWIIYMLECITEIVYNCQCQDASVKETELTSQKEFFDFAVVSVTLPKSSDATDHMHLFTKQ